MRRQQRLLVYKTQARKKKDGEPYEFWFNGQHLQVMTFLLRHGPTSDYDVVRALALGSHQLGARRCELRDAGLVEQDGTCKSGMTWRLTVAGADLLDEILLSTPVGSAR